MTEVANMRIDMSSLSSARYEIYAYLGQAFCEPPTKDSLAAILSESFLNSASILFCQGNFEKLQQYQATAEVDSDFEQQAHQEFMNLFKVPGSQYLTPYESVYRDSREVAGENVKGLLMGSSAVEVQQWYKLAALDISEEYKDLPDHIGLELNFLAYLCMKEQEFARAGVQSKLTRTWEMQRDFLTAHIVRWIGDLRTRLYEKSQHAYFRTVVDLAVDFTNKDLATLEKIVGPSSGKPTPDYDSLA